MFAGPTSDVPFDVPSPAVLLGPAPGATVDSAARLRWSGEPGAAKYGFVAARSELTEDGPRHVDFRLVETGDAGGCLPAVPGLDLSGMRCDWQVGWLNGAAVRFYETGILSDDFRVSWSEWRQFVVR